MGKVAKTTEGKGGEVVPVNFVRTENVLRKYPMHILQKGQEGVKDLVFREQGGEVIWRVLFTAPEGAPGSLAYRIDRLIIDKVLDEQTRFGNVPEIIRLATLNEICDALDIDRTGHNKKNIQKALLQLEGTKVDVDGDVRMRFARYDGVVFTGNKLPDGTRADAVYLGVSVWYRGILAKSARRPLDYDYLKELPPAASRLYEVLGSRVFAALQMGGKNPEARLLYSEFCELSALTRYTQYKHMSYQMKRFHKPHIESGYISGVSYDARTDKRGMPDWMMIYIPGEKARHEFKAAMKRGEVQKPGEVIKIGASTATMRTHETELVRNIRIYTEEPLQASFEFPVTPPLTEAQELAGRLIAAGVWVTKAQALVELYPDATRIWVDVYERGLLGKKDDPAAYLVRAIGENAQPPKAYRDAKAKTLKAKETKAKASTWRLEEETAFTHYVESLSPEALKDFDREALAARTLKEREFYMGLRNKVLQCETMQAYRLDHWRRTTGA